MAEMDYKAVFEENNEFLAMFGQLQMKKEVALSFAYTCTEIPMVNIEYTTDDGSSSDEDMQYEDWKDIHARRRRSFAAILSKLGLDNVAAIWFKDEHQANQQLSLEDRAFVGRLEKMTIEDVDDADDEVDDASWRPSHKPGPDYMRRVNEMTNISSVPNNCTIDPEEAGDMQHRFLLRDFRQLLEEADGDLEFKETMALFTSSMLQQVRQRKQMGLSEPERVKSKGAPSKRRSRS
ncbi:hypothetical protein BGW42_008250, partial [Actinomortierella wolfii]